MISETRGLLVIVMADSANDGRSHSEQCMIGMCPLATHDYRKKLMRHYIIAVSPFEELSPQAPRTVCDFLFGLSSSCMNLPVL